MSTTSPPRPAATPRYEHFVEEQLTRATRRIRFLDLSAALLVLTIVTLAYALGMALLDRWLELPAGFRQFCFITYAVAVIGYTYYAVALPLLGRINPRYAAQQVERTLPGAKNSVVNWLDLRDQSLPVAIRGALTHRAAKELAHADMEQAFNARWAAWLSGCMLVLMAGMAVLFLQGPPQFFSLLGRAFAPFAPAPLTTRTQIAILQPAGGHATVQVGRAITFQVRIDGRIPDRGQPDALKFLFRYQTDVPYEERLPESGDTTGDFVLTFPAFDVHNGFYYKFQGGDAETPEFRVQVRSAPLIVDFDVIYHFRPYLRRPDQKSRDPNLESLRGTQATIIAHTNRTVQSGTLDPGDDRPIEGKRIADDPRALSFSPLTIDQDGSYKISFMSKEGEKSGESAPFAIKAIPDRVPIVELTQPGQDLTLPANGILRLKGSATDDFGLTALALQVMNGRRTLSFPYRAGKSFQLEDGGFARQVDYHGFLDLGKITLDGRGLQPHQTIDYWLEATDNCDYPGGKPNVGQSRHYHITITEPEENQRREQERRQAEKDQAQHDKEQDQKLEQQGGAENQRPQDKQTERNQGQADNKQTNQENEQSSKQPPKDYDLQNRADQLSKAIGDKSQSNQENKDPNAKPDQQPNQQPGSNESQGTNKEGPPEQKLNKSGAGQSKSDQGQDKNQASGSDAKSQNQGGKSDQQGKAQPGDSSGNGQSGAQSKSKNDGAAKQPDSGESGKQGAKFNQQSENKQSSGNGQDKSGNKDGRGNQSNEKSSQGANQQPESGQAGASQGGDQSKQQSETNQTSRDQQGKSGQKPSTGNADGADKQGKDNTRQKSGAKSDKSDQHSSGGAQDQKGSNGGQDQKSGDRNAEGQRQEQTGDKSDQSKSSSGDQTKGKQQNGNDSGQKDSMNRQDSASNKQNRSGADSANSKASDGKQAGEGDKTADGQKNQDASSAAKQSGDGKNDTASKAGTKSSDSATQKNDAGNDRNQNKRGGDQSQDEVKQSQGANSKQEAERERQTSGAGSAESNNGEKQSSEAAKRGNGGQSGQQQTNDDGNQAAGKGSQDKPDSQANQKKPATDADVPDLVKALKNRDASVRRESAKRLEDVKDGIKDPNLRQQVEKALQESGQLDKARAGQDGKSKGESPAANEQSTKKTELGDDPAGNQGPNRKQSPADLGTKSGNAKSEDSANVQGQKGNSSDPTEITGQRNGAVTNSQVEPKPSAADKRFQLLPGALQLETIKKHVNKDVLKKVNMTEAEYQAFLKDYEEMVRRRGQEPGNDEKLSDPRLSGSAKNRRTRQVVPGGPGAEDKSAHAGTMEAPPGYREIYRDFSEKLSERFSGHERDREKK